MRAISTCFPICLLLIGCGYPETGEKITLPENKFQQPSLEPVQSLPTPEPLRPPLNPKLVLNENQKSAWLKLNHGKKADSLQIACFSEEKWKMLCRSHNKDVLADDYGESFSDTKKGTRDLNKAKQNVSQLERKVKEQKKDKLKSESDAKALKDLEDELVKAQAELAQEEKKPREVTTAWEQVEKHLKDLGKDSSVTAVAVVSLYHSAGPQVIKWYQHDGAKFISSGNQPVSTLESSLHEFLFDLQCRAGQSK